MSETLYIGQEGPQLSIEVLDLDGTCWIGIDLGKGRYCADIKLGRKDAYLLGQALVDRYI